MRIYSKILLAVLVCLTVLNTAWAENSKDIVLKNGMRIFIKPMRAAPVVTLSYWVKNGSTYEEEHEEGFSELVGKLLFASSVNYPDNSLRNELTKLGVRYSRCSSNDCMAFTLTGSSSHLEHLLELGSEGFFNSIFSDDDLKKAIEATKKEIEATESRPEILVNNIMIQKAITTHPSRRPYYGLNPNFDGCNAFLLNRYYKKSYSPANSVLVITGDVDLEKAVELVKKNLESIRSNNYAEPEFPKEPAQSEYREVVRYADLKKVYLSFGWKVPSVESSDIYAFYVVARLLGGDKNSLLWKKQVGGRETAEYICASYASSRFGGLLMVNAVTTRSKLQYCIDGVRKNIVDLVDEYISEETLERIKNEIITEDAFNCESIENCAIDYGSYAIMTEAIEADSFDNYIKAVNIEDIKRVSAEYLRDEFLTVGILESAPIPENALPMMYSLESGSKLILKENHNMPIVSVSCKFLAGGAKEDRKMPGLAKLTAEMLLRSSDSKGKSYMSKLEELGAKVSYEIQKGYVSYDMKVMSSAFIPAFEVFMNMLSNPEFPSGTGRARGAVEDSLIAENANTMFQNELNGLNKLFANSSLAYSICGKQDDLNKLKRSDVIDFYKKNYVASNMVIATVGDFYGNELRDFLLSAVNRIPSEKSKDSKEAKDSKNSKESKENRFEELKSDSLYSIKRLKDLSSYVCFMNRTMPVKDEKFMPFMVGCKLLNDSLKKNLPQLDNCGKLSETFELSNVNLGEIGYFKASFEVAQDDVATLSQMIKSKIDEFKNKQISNQEIENVKSSILGKFSLRMTDSLSLAQRFSQDEILGLGYDFYNRMDGLLSKVTSESVSEAIKEYMLPDGKTVISVLSGKYDELTYSDGRIINKVKSDDSSSIKSDDQKSSDSDSKSSKKSDKSEKTSKNKDKKENTKSESSKEKTQDDDKSAMKSEETSSSVSSDSAKNESTKETVTETAKVSDIIESLKNSSDSSSNDKK